MNLKAERIDRMIQLVNRNLLLISFGQVEDASALDFKNLQKVDTSVFGHDKFAFDMVHYVQTYKRFKDSNKNNIHHIWERDFASGLEALLVECATVQDDIERDCFVSRVYRWFTEKLSEFRDIPEQIPDKGSTENIENLEEPENAVNKDVKSNALLLKDDEKYNLQSALRLSQRRAKLKSATNHDIVSFPSILRRPATDSTKEEGHNDPSSNYGLIYHKPETEAEKNMHQLWMARRRQEMFDWKSQQQVDLVMNRLALHKSRLESNALRRQETNTLMSQGNEIFGSRKNYQYHDDNARFAPVNRVPSAGRSRQISNLQAIYANLIHPPKKEEIVSPDNSSEALKEMMDSKYQADDRDLQSDSKLPKIESASLNNSPGASISKEPSIEVIPSKPTKSKPVRREIKPMRFSTKLPSSFEARSNNSQFPASGKSISSVKTPISNRSRVSDRFGVQDDSKEKELSSYERTQYYMQLSDSDDDDKSEIHPPIRLTSAPLGRGKQAIRAGKKIPIAFKHEKPPMRERPLSAKIFHSIANDDPEAKVYYRHSNYRRMPLSTKLEEWLDDKESDRIKKSRDYAAKIIEAFLIKTGKAKKAKEGNKMNTIIRSKSPSKSSKLLTKGGTSGKSDGNQTPGPQKYRSASEFMEKNFPTFDNYEDDVYGFTGITSTEAMGPMRTAQLIECAQIMNAFEIRQMNIDENAVKKALVIPQDRPEALCLENLRGPKDDEGLMVNPNPSEYWRKFHMKSKGTKKKKKKKINA